MPEDPWLFALVSLGCCCIGCFVGMAFGVIFMGRLIAATQRLGYIEENQMDENRDGTVENAVKCRILVSCPLDRSADRLMNHHGFALLPKCHSHYEKVMEGTWSDIMTYVQMLRGIEGIASVEVNFDEVQPVKWEGKK